MEPIRVALLGAGSRGKHIYADWARNHPDEMKLVAVAEPNDDKRNAVIAEHGIDQEYAVKDWQDLFKKPLEIDAVIIATQDQMHKQAILAAIDHDYHILCEKPIVTNEADAKEIAKKSAGFSKVFVISHVLRYSPFFTRVKKLISQDEIGQLIGIELDENVGHIHMSHSFVRGHWNNSRTSAPMILSKSCHDMDILLYLAGDDCLSLSSYGDLNYFTRENKPEGAPVRCTDGCPHYEACPYAAQKIYLGTNINWPVNVITTDLSVEGRLKALKEGPWGRCVYQCDNDVVDHQTVNARFRNGVVATFTMSAFTMETHRELRLMGTKAELKGDMEKGIITITDFSCRDTKTIQIETKREGHSGSDELFVADFVRLVRGNILSGETSVNASLQSHFMAFAAETSRVSDGQQILL
ncbi:Gfo/Idh/MocA family oxidoreductase [uncultured Sphaerochaeta sp.]|uniref:Gfo/Idh/MocA family protein n=1 Tax=uncultured Sphaerochaeta sp. TaxID=886478 RepID=UPI002AA6CAF9|nr:Gfo/Idh/MocA family oxidoreductase [uncultured Sphaerochaeta sp.]